MRLRILFAIAALFALCADASARPLDRLRARFGGSCGSACAPQAGYATQYAPPQQVVYPAGHQSQYMPSYAPAYLPTYYAPQTGCVGGSCPLPQRFVFPHK